MSKRSIWNQAMAERDFALADLKGIHNSAGVVDLMYYNYAYSLLLEIKCIYIIHCLSRLLESGPQILNFSGITYLR